ncbi:hypothetical protein [Sphingomonas mesophila]|uniref:hypothetical protein n=1 Tax=Sphingomonas mesophila TaxID=2303576 RepID=UPI0013C30C1C|nr:hypothetical protein [Sphingomonas mesophila]
MTWLDECEAALADADYLAGRLARGGSTETAADATALRIRIAALRAEFERARIAMGAPRLGGVERRKERAPAPWPAIETFSRG